MGAVRPDLHRVGDRLRVGPLEIGRTKSFRANRGGLILAYASLGFLWPFAAMHQREVLAAGGGTLNDTIMSFSAA